YYRLNVFPIRIPPLRERREEIPELVRHFIARFAAEEGKSFIRGVAAPALQLLMHFDWPGNVRQLENAVFRAVVLADEPMLTEEEFPQIAAYMDGSTPDEDHGAPLPDFAALTIGEPASPSAAGGPSLFASNGDVRPLAEIEAAVIRLALEKYGGRMTHVARKLGIGRSTLYRKLKELGLSDMAEGIAAE
ncbi:MAG: sigma-54-dependent Fis family transcriptional regulator, partial [Rhizobiales bacterium]|nr:sigma-54-dependent Fis family transcriptional regulator [Hyphomicrobiales bacterium]